MFLTGQIFMNSFSTNQHAGINFTIKNFFVIAGIFFLLFVLISCRKALLVKQLTIIKANGEEVFIKLEIAKTDETRQKGFMHRKNIPYGTGMLFVFEKEERLRFWMKNTPHPLSIAFIDKNGNIKEIYDMKPFSKETIVSNYSCMYALEVPAGWFEKEEIGIGDSLKLDF